MNRQVLVAMTAVLLLCSCSSKAQVPREGLAVLHTDPSQNPGADSKNASALNAGPGEKFDAVEDEYISKETLKAWRHALAHDDHEGMPDAEWKAIRIKDEEESMAALKKLADGHQTSSYIKTMMGQVKQHFGKKEEAAAYYEEALLQNRRDPILMFKAAEMRRNNGNNKKALVYYNLVLKTQSDFPGAQIGAAKCMLADASTVDAGRKILKDLLAKNPDDKDAQAALDESNKSDSTPGKTKESAGKKSE